VISGTDSVTEASRRKGPLVDSIPTRHYWEVIRFEILETDILVAS